jgi:hypothetical protein
MRSQIWKKSGNSKKGDPGKRVYRTGFENMCATWGIDIKSWENRSDEVLFTTAELLRRDLGGAVKKYEQGLNGSTRKGYCVHDPINPGELPFLTKVYQYGDDVFVVVPPEKKNGYVSDITGVKKWDRIS